MLQLKRKKLKMWENPSLMWRYIGVLFLMFLMIFIILLFVNYKMSKDYLESTNRLAFLLTQQVERVLTSEHVDLTRLRKSRKRKLRQILQQFTRNGSKVHYLFLINPENRIVVCNEPIYENKVYTREIELRRLKTREPKIVDRSVNEQIEELDVIWPIFIKGQFIGHLRAKIWNDDYFQFRQRKMFLLFSLAVLVFLGMLSIGWISTHFRKREATPTETSDSDSEPFSGTTGEEKKQLPSMFSDLTRMYRNAADLDRSYHQSEDKLHSMMRVLNQGLMIMDLNMNILTYNEYLLDVFKIRSTVNATRRVYEVLQKNPRLLEIYRRAKDPLTYEVKQRLDMNLLNGRQIDVEVAARPFQNGEDLLGVTFYIKNLQVLDELEQSLQRSMTYGVISQLASSIGHEIRNPLSSLAIHTEIVENMVAKTVEDENRLMKIKKSLDILNSEIERLQKLIDQFFTLAKSKTFGLTFENINDVMGEVLELVQQQSYEKNVHIMYEFATNLPMVKISKDQMKQVVINLILNGFDAMPGGGELTLSTYFQEGNVVIAVKDTGQGIPDDVRDSVFDLYFTTKDSGGGIGLAISRKIVEAHEGKIYFESEPGVGTIFYIELPTSQN